MAHRLIQAFEGLRIWNLISYFSSFVPWANISEILYLFWCVSESYSTFFLIILLFCLYEDKFVPSNLGLLWYRGPSFGLTVWFSWDVESSFFFRNSFGIFPYRISKIARHSDGFVHLFSYFHGYVYHINLIIIFLMPVRWCGCWTFGWCASPYSFNNRLSVS